MLEYLLLIVLFTLVNANISSRDEIYRIFKLLIFLHITSSLLKKLHAHRVCVMPLCVNTTGKEIGIPKPESSHQSLLNKKSSTVR